MKNNQKKMAKGNKIKRLITIPFLFLAWFSPHSKIRVFFHRLRGVKIGKNVEIGYFCIIGNVHPNLVIIEDNCTITARVTILDHDNSYYYTGIGDVKLDEVCIKQNSFIGIGSVIMPGVTIGKNVIIGALSFVNKNIDDNSIVAGIPCKLIKKIGDNYK